jgi:hypothetical protein
MREVQTEKGPSHGMQISRSWQQKKAALTALAAALHDLAAAVAAFPDPNAVTKQGSKQASQQLAAVRQQLLACGDPAEATLAAAHALHATSGAAGSRSRPVESAMHEWDGAAPLSVVGGTLGLPADEFSGLSARGDTAASVDEVAADICTGVVQMHELLGAIQQAGSDVAMALHEHATCARHPSMHEGMLHFWPPFT